MWCFSKSARWEERLADFEKIVEEYFRNDPFDELTSGLDREIKSVNRMFEQRSRESGSRRDAFNEQVNRLNAEGRIIEVLHKQLKHNRPHPSDVDAIDSFNAKVRELNERVGQYQAQAEKVREIQQDYNRESKVVNVEADRHRSDVKRRQTDVMRKLKDYRHWLDRKGQERFFSDLNQMFVELCNKCRDEHEKTRDTTILERLRELRRELGARAAKQAEGRDAGMMLVETILCGLEPCMLIVDTGSTVTTLSPAMVEALDLEGEVGRDVELHLAAGITIKAPQLLIPELSVDGHQAKYVKAVVLKETMWGVDGILGQSFLSRFDYTIEGQKPRRLTLRPQSVTAAADESSPASHGKGYDVFICHKTEDKEVAKTVYELLRETGYRAFYSPITLYEEGDANFAEVIDQALESSRHMVVVSSQRKYLEEPWVRGEWQLFDTLIRSSRKRGNIIPVLAGRLDVGDLPVSLARYNAIHTSDKNWKTQLIHMLPR